jgi:hypothetical protein
VGSISVRLRVNGVVRLEQDIPLADLVNGTQLRIEPRLGTAATNIQIEVTNRRRAICCSADASWSSPREVRDARVVAVARSVRDDRHR